MKLTIVWTNRAIQGYDSIVNYIQQNWPPREVKNFVRETEEFFTLLSEYPELLQKTSRYKYIYRAPMNKLTLITLPYLTLPYLTYRVKPRKAQIEIINIRSTRQKPLM